MKETVEIFGMNKEVEIDTEKCFADEESGYEQAYKAEDGFLYGYDEAICQWVQLGYIDRQ